jgi:5-methylcytosine-specific restriction endonuclease McrA
MLDPLQLPTLILNKNWCPISFTTTQEAIILVARTAAKIVESNTYQLHDLYSWHFVSSNKKVIVRSENLALARPEVIVLTRYGDNLFNRQAVFSRKNLMKRDNNTCQYCGDMLSNDSLTIDHVIARSNGGRHSWVNCVVACSECNRKKGDRQLEELDMKLLSVPKAPTIMEISVNLPKHSRCEFWNEFIS